MAVKYVFLCLGSLCTLVYIIIGGYSNNNINKNEIFIFNETIKGGIDDTCISRYVAAVVNNKSEEIISWGGEKLPNLIQSIGAYDMSRNVTFPLLHSKNDICLISKQSINITTPYGIIFHLNENWGGISTQIIGQTVKWGNIIKGLKKKGCTIAHIKKWYDNSNLKIIYTTQHQSPILSHEKVWSIPLGTKKRQNQFKQMNIAAVQRPGLRKRLMFVALSDYGIRSDIVDTIRINTEDIIQNQYGQYRGEKFQEQIRVSKFVLIVSGLGYDTYRFWETLYSGAIPIVLRHTGIGGLMKTYGWAKNGNHKLPVIWVDSFEEITQELLNKEYIKIMSQCNDPTYIYDFNMLTTSYWVQKFKTSVLQ